MTNNTIKLWDALQRMRLMSEMNIPFSISFITYNESTQDTKGLRVVDKALLRVGYRADQSHLSDILVAYTDLQNEGARQFYLPLLMTFNGYKVIP